MTAMSPQAHTLGLVTTASASSQGGLEALLKKVFDDLKVIGTTAEDIRKFVQGATASLAWWGWTLSLTEESTQSLVNLLNNDLPALLAVAGALIGSVPPLAAIAAILKIMESILVAWINAEDRAKKGVMLHGYLWIAVFVEANKA